ncbi:MAG: DUF5984 family protein [Ktedonobacteraceae bacterium]
MLFHFQLRPLSDVAPWGYPDRLCLHWFGLTDGWYWLEMGQNNEFFRYTTDILMHWQRNHPEIPPYADYYVVRLWEDILEILPDILEPLPPKLVQMLDGEEQISRWQERMKKYTKMFESDDEDEEETEEDKQAWEIYMQATMWWNCRRLNTGYLTASPHLWFWNDGRDVHIFWDNSESSIENIPVWTAQRGHIQLPYAQFLDEVDSLHTRLFATMEERIQAAKKMLYRDVPREHAEASSYIPRPLPGAEYSISDIILDRDQLEKEQQTRFQRLSKSLGRVASKTATDWNVVFDAMTVMDKLSGFSTKE